jgi:hypothetical protein
MRGEQPDPPDRVGPREPGKLEIHQDDVRTKVDHQLDGVFSVGGLATRSSPASDSARESAVRITDSSSTSTTVICRRR